LPDLKKGSIIEVYYIIKSDFYFNLREWYFQITIPVIHSEYHVKIPEYFDYNQTQKGYFVINFESEISPNSIRITYHERENSQQVVKNNSYTRTIEFQDKKIHYYADEIPAFPIEKHLKTKENYLSKIEFELSSIKYPDQAARFYIKTWKDVNEELKEHSSFDKELLKSGHLKDDAEIIQKLNLTGLLLIKIHLSSKSGYIPSSTISHTILHRYMLLNCQKI